jgi:hypothetical protein
MAEYGVLPTGFSRKPLTTILAEIEASLITEFGPGVIQTSQSPLGQINGLMAEIITKLWEQAEDVYQSYDPYQAEGTRLDTLGSIRLIRRGTSTDEEYRQAITNAGQARIDLQDINRAIAALVGVTYSHVWVNDTGQVDENGMPPGSICVAVTGGDGDEIAEAIRQYIVPGPIVFGNTIVESVIDGFCRSFRILRPINVPVELTITIRTRRDALGCPPPAASAVKAAFLSSVYLLNGENVSYYRVRSVIESLFSNVEVVSIVGERDGIPQGANLDVVIAFIERASLAPDDVSVVVVS